MKASKTEYQCETTQNRFAKKKKKYKNKKKEKKKKSSILSQPYGMGMKC